MTAAAEHGDTPPGARGAPGTPGKPGAPEAPGTPGAPEGATERRPGWRHLGPGMVVAATGVGAGDLVSTLLAGSKFGYTLMWAAVLGCVVKIALAEAVGRWHLATGRTLLEGWRTLGPWTTVYFAVYVVIWGFVYGAAAMTASALPLQALFPDGPGLKYWAIGTGLLGLAFVWFNRYAVVEKVMMGFVGVMFVVVVFVAIRVSPKLDDSFAGLLPVLPDGSLVYTLGLVGGVGGTITMAAYGYWINAKGWTDTGWMRMMRFDNRVAYLTTGIFVVAMLIIGAELLHSGGASLREGDRGLLDLGDILEERFGGFTAKLFLVGFFAASFSSLVGVWHGVSLLFADFVDRLRAARGGTAPDTKAPDTTAPDTTAPDTTAPDTTAPDTTAPDATAAVAGGEQERSPAFRGYVLWLTFPPMALLWLDEPFGLVIAYGVLGAFFMPFLAVTLLWLLNTSRTPSEWRSGLLSNAVLSASAVLFLILCVEEVRDLPW